METIEHAMLRSTCKGNIGALNIDLSVSSLNLDDALIEDLETIVVEDLLESSAGSKYCSANAESFADLLVVAPVCGLAYLGAVDGARWSFSFIVGRYVVASCAYLWCRCGVLAVLTYGYHNCSRYELILFLAANSVGDGTP